MLGAASLDAILELVCAQAKEHVPSAHEVSVTLIRDGEFSTAAFTGPIAKALDEHQYEVKSGPCLDASSQGIPFEIFEASKEDRWPHFVEELVTHGIGGCLSYPMTTKEKVVGALNIYSIKEGAFDEKDREAARDFSLQAGTLLANAVSYMQKDEITDQLREALASRETIGKAIGILMEREGLTDDEAFSKLRRTSQDANLKLREIAERLLQRANERSRGGSNDGS